MNPEGLSRELVEAFERTELDTKVSNIRHLEEQSYHEPDADPYAQVENARKIAKTNAIQSYLSAMAILKQNKIEQ